MQDRYEAFQPIEQLSIFISYKWNEISEREADRLCQVLELSKIRPIRDKYCLQYGESIKEFMNSITMCYGVILIICDDYFYSINCMYEGITTMLNCKKTAIIRMVESSIYNMEFKQKIKKHWDEFIKGELSVGDLEKAELICNNIDDFITWISDTNSVAPNDSSQFEKELNKHIAKMSLNISSYQDMVIDLMNSKYVTISKVCEPACEERYFFRNIDFSIQNSPVQEFSCFYNFVITLDRIDKKENVDIYINSVVGIEEGTMGADFSKYYFVIPKQESLETLAFEEKIGKEKSEIEYNKHRIIINL